MVKIIKDIKIKIVSQGSYELFAIYYCTISKQFEIQVWGCTDIDKDYIMSFIEGGGVSSLHSSQDSVQSTFKDALAFVKNSVHARP